MADSIFMDTPMKELAIEDIGDDDDIDETLPERLWGLLEMFPDPLRNACSSATKFSWNSTKLCFSYGRSTLWIVTSTFTILALPWLFERERMVAQEMQRAQQNQILLGPNAAVSGGQGMPGLYPPMMPPPQQPQ